MRASYLRFLLCASLVLAAACAVRQRTDVDVKAELEAMFDTDQAHRGELDKLGKQYGYDSAQMNEFGKTVQQSDAANIARLVEIIESYGWPGRTLAGEKGSMGAFLVLQHADYAYQKKYLPLVRTAVSTGELRPDNLALLEDRILMREGKKQLYGTQLKTNDKGAWEFYPIEDEPNVDKRRLAAGLPPLAEYAKHFGLQYQPK